MSWYVCSPRMSAISNKPCSFSLEKLRISIVSNPAQISDDEEEILPTESSVSSLSLLPDCLHMSMCAATVRGEKD